MFCHVVFLPSLDKDSATELKACGLVKFWILKICLLVYGLFIYPVISQNVKTLFARAYLDHHISNALRRIMTQRQSSLRAPSILLSKATEVCSTVKCKNFVTEIVLTNAINVIKELHNKYQRVHCFVVCSTVFSANQRRPCKS